MAIYEKIEIDAVGSKVIDNETQKTLVVKHKRITHAEQTMELNDKGTRKDKIYN